MGVLNYNLNQEVGKIMCGMCAQKTVSGKSTPKVLYRYYSWHDKHENAKTVLSNNELFLLNPLSFNDPFDSRIPVGIAKRKDLETHIVATLRLYTSKNPLSAVNFDAKVKGMMAKVPKTQEEFVNYWKKDGGTDDRKGELIRQYMNDLPKTADEDTVAGYHLSCEHDSAVNSYGVYCLSERRDNILMWSHYADYHKGVCFGFNSRLVFDKNSAFTMLEEKGTTALGIKYQEVPELNYPSKDFHEKVLLTKFCDWEYESEWRVIEPILEGQRLFKIPPEVLSEVILGCEMPEQDRDEVIGLVKGRETKPKVYRARKSSTKFALEFEEISLD